MAQTDKTYDDSKRVGEMLGAMETARLFVLDVLQTGRFVFEKGLVSAYEATRQELKFLFKRFTFLDYVFGNLGLLGLLLCFTVFLSGFGLLGYQTVVWLQDGVWNAMPLMLVFSFLFEGTSFGVWMQNPDSWAGLHQIMEWVLINTPISLVLIVDGLIMSAGMAAVILFAVMVRRFQFKHREQD
ncbi:MAG: hypothetical protein V3T82_02020 [Nitrospinaceae bacterium]